jgi:hypothetical protein
MVMPPVFGPPDAMSWVVDYSNFLAVGRSRRARRATTGASGTVAKLPEMMLDIIASGGLMRRLKETRPPTFDPS